MADSKTAEFRLSHSGVVSITAPDLLRDGQYRRVSNVAARQEGSLWSRAGSKFVGQFASDTNPYHAAKLLLPGNARENPLAPANNLRYVGAFNSGSHNIERTTTWDDGTRATVLTAADASTANHWEMAPYSAGATGDPWAFFATPSGMFKDHGTSPFNPLVKWGVLPSYGVATASQVIISSPISVTAATTATPIVITLASPTGLKDNDVVSFTGIGIVPDNHQFAVLVTGFNSTSFALYYAATVDVSLAGQPVAPSGTFTGGGQLNTAGVPAFGKLNGGANNTPNNTQPYDYIYLYIDSTTNNVGNPSQTMLTGSNVTNGAPLGVHTGQILVTVWGTDDSRVTSIAIFRRGGILFDTWRRLATVPNNGLGAASTFTDNVADATLAFEDVVETDNDPPVTSTVPTPIVTTISDTSVGPGRVTIHLTNGSATAKLTKGTQAHIAGVNGASPETVTIDTVGSGSITTYIQFVHTAGDVVEIDAITNQPCRLAIPCSQGDCIIVAGDPNNPHTAYKSKAGFPESFPVGTDAAGAVTQVNAGTPSNGIVNMCEFRQEVVFMNVSSLFTSVILSDAGITNPGKVANKGLIAQSAWCKTPMELWFCAIDGIYSYDGSSVQKRSGNIDGIFHGQQVNNIPPVDFTNGPVGLGSMRMAYRRGKVYFTYTDTSAATLMLECEPAAGDRWAVYSQGSSFPITLIFQEEDTDSLIIGWNSVGKAQFAVADAVFNSGGVDYTADGWSTDPRTTGGPIAYDIWLPWFDMGSPVTEKLFEEIFLECNPQLATAFPGATLSVDLLLNFSDTPVETIQVVIPGAQNTLNTMGLISLLPQTVNNSGRMDTFGREAFAVSLHIYGNAYPVQAQFFRVLVKYQETGLLTAGGTSDWDQLGHPYDKRLFQMVVVFDTQGINQALVMDTITGLGAGTYNQAAQTFTLNNPTIIGNGRAMQQFPMADATIVKQVRIRRASTQAATGQSTTAFFRIFSVTFPGQENYPEDVIPSTEWDDGGYPFAKYANQATLEVDTNGVAVLAQVQTDGALAETITVTGTNTNRDQNITLNSGLKGRKWRLFIDRTQTALTTGGGKFQLFQKTGIFRFQQADRGEVGHTFDWDDLGHPWDKQLESVTIEWDNTNNSAVTLQLDTISGLGGGTLNSNVAQFTLSGGRSKNPFALPVDTVAKLIRIYPITSPLPAGFLQWKYQFKQTNDPPDVVPWTEWSDQGYPYGKLGRNLLLTIDTNNVACSVALQADGVTLQTFTVTTTYTTRRVTLPCNFNLTGVLWRLVNTPGSGGKAKIWAWSLDFVKLPPAVTQWNSYQQSFGYAGWKFLMLYFVDYQCSATLTMTLLSDTGTLTISLPAHVARGTERGNFPSVWGSGLNQSKLYGVQFSSTAAFLLFADMSRFEWFKTGERHEQFEKIALSEFMQIPI